MIIFTFQKSNGMLRTWKILIYWQLLKRAARVGKALFISIIIGWTVFICLPWITENSDSNLQAFDYASAVLFFASTVQRGKVWVISSYVYIQFEMFARKNKLMSSDRVENNPCPSAIWFCLANPFFLLLHSECNHLWTSHKSCELTHDQSVPCRITPPIMQHVVPNFQSIFVCLFPKHAEKQ